jgi:hypothetical protein
VIDFEVICELATKAGNLDRLSLAEAAHVNSRRGADEDVDFTRGVVDNDLVTTVTKNASAKSAGVKYLCWWFMSFLLEADGPW